MRSTVERDDQSCPHCKSKKTKKDGFYFSEIYEEKRQKYKCLICSKKFSAYTDTIVEGTRQSKKFDPVIMDLIAEKFMSVRDIQSKLGVGRRTVLRSLERIATPIKLGLMPGDYYQHMPIIIFHHVKNDEKEKMEFEEGKIKEKEEYVIKEKKVFVQFGFTKDGSIVDVGIGKKGTPCSEEWVEKYNVHKWLTARSEEWLVRRLCLFLRAYNKPFFDKESDLKKRIAPQSNSGVQEKNLNEHGKTKRGNRHKKQK